MDDGTAAGCRLIHLDVVGGIAGDMFVAAMLDCFPALAEGVLRDVAAVLPPDCGTAWLRPGSSGGIGCLRFGLAPPPGRDRDRGTDPADHDHHHHHGTRFADLCRRIRSAPLDPATARHAEAILTALARAEAQVHRVAVEDVHFHEVGDWDSLIDVVAAGSLIAALEPARWTVSDLPRGAGLVRTQHGLLPVPAPATLALLEGFAWRDDAIGGERVTPTGAAILCHLCAGDGPPVPPAGPLGTLASSGTGAGTRDLPGMPNILRVQAFDPAAAGTATAVDVIAFDIDDMTGEEIAVAAERLRAAPGVIDLTLLTLQGKKGRPVVRFEIQCPPGAASTLAGAVLSETSTLGLRWQRLQRVVLTRQAGTAGDLRIKTATRPDGTRTTKVEADDLAGVAGLGARRAAARKAEGGE